MQVMFLSGGKQGRALMGDVIEDTGNYYKVKITSYESGRDKKEMGKYHMVRKDVAQVIEQLGRGR